MPLKVRPLSPFLAEVARTELNEDPARTEQDVAHIREWLKKQPHLKARTDDQWLLTFLRGCKFSLERTKEKLDTYYTVRTMLPEFFANRDPMLPEIQEVLKSGSTLPLTKVLNEKGQRVIFGAIGKSDPKKNKIEDAMKTSFMMMDIMLMEDDHNVICGNVNVMDMVDVSVAHLIQMTPAMAKKVTMLMQEAYPIRTKAVHYVNVPKSFYAIYNLFKSFLKEKLQRRLYIHGTMDELYQQIPQKSLPLEYGGEAGSLDELTAEWKKKVESYREWFLEDEKYKTNEKKRVGKPKTQEDLFGLEGSFRQLNFD